MFLFQETFDVKTPCCYIYGMTMLYFMDQANELEVLTNSDRLIIGRRPHALGFARLKLYNQCLVFDINRYVMLHC